MTSPEPTSPPTLTPSTSALRGRLSVLSGVGLLLLAVIALNVLALRFDARWDLTSEGLYTLSAPTVTRLHALQEPVHAEVFLSEDLPPPLHTTRARMEDVLEEYVAESEGRFSFSFTTPRPGDEAQQGSAASKGCAQVALGARSEGAMSVRAIYKCVVFTQGERTQVVRDVRLTGDAELDDLELVLTRALFALTSPARRRLGFVTGYGGPADMPEFVERAAPIFEELYGEQITPEAVPLDGEASRIPDELDALVILDVSRTLSPRARFQIDRFLQRGGALAWFQSPTVPDEQVIAKLVEQLGPTDTMPEVRRVVDTGLEAQFRHYGAWPRHDLVLNREHAMEVVMLTAEGVSRAENPAIFQADQLDRSVPFLRNAMPLIWPAPGSIALTPAEGLAPGVIAQPIARTQPSAVRLASPLLTRTYEAVRESSEGDERGEFTLMATLMGKLPSAFEEALPEGVSASERYRGERGEARVLLASSGDFIIPQPAFGYSDEMAITGQQLFFQSMEWLVQEEALGQIRDRRAPAFIGEVPAETRRRMQFINIVFVPACFGLVGYVMFLRRRRRRERYASLGQTRRDVKEG